MPRPTSPEPLVLRRPSASRLRHCLLAAVANVGGLAVADGVLVSPATGTVSLMVHADRHAEIAVTDTNTDLSTKRCNGNNLGICLQEAHP